MCLGSHMQLLLLQLLGIVAWLSLPPREDEQGGHRALGKGHLAHSWSLEASGAYYSMYGT